jgi:hypothetical protein
LGVEARAVGAAIDQREPITDASEDGRDYNEGMAGAKGLVRGRSCGTIPGAMYSPVVTCRRAGLALLGSLALLTTVSLPSKGGDRQDSPDLDFTALVGQRDLAGLYVFRSPTNANNTVFVLLAGPHAQLLTRPFFDPKASYEFKIDSTEDFKPDLTFRARFSAPDENGVQNFKLQQMIGRQPFKTIAKGTTAQNIPIEGGGMTRAGLFDDPFFFDAYFFNDLAAEGVGNFPRSVGIAKNYYGPNANILGVVIEIPSASLVKEGEMANNRILGIWGRVTKNGVQVDRVGRPMTNLLLVPPLPRNADVTDLRKRLNRTQPTSDVRLFAAPAAEVLQDFFGRTEAAANEIANFFMPDVLFFQVGNPNGFGTFIAGPPESELGTVFGNGRRLRDDVVDILLNIFTNGAIASDNVPDDNGTKITDGNMGTTAAFPYIGAVNQVPSGPNP